MGDKRNKTLVAWGQNGAILVLLLSAVWLLGQAQLYTLDTQEGWVGRLFSLVHQEETVAPRPAEGWGQGGTLRPVRMALLGEMGCYALQYDDQAVAELFAQVTNPLVDVLTGAGEPYQVTQREWETVLSGGQTGVYLDFLGHVPLQALYTWTSGGNTPGEQLTGTVRRLAVTVTQRGDTRLYYINEIDGLYYACDSTAQVGERLEQLMEGVSPNGQFAFQETQLEGLDPYTLLGFLTPRPAVYTSWNPLPLMSENQEGMLGLEEFARQLDFHPQSYTTYAVPDGMTIREGGDTLTVTQDGLVSFRATEDETARYPIASDGGEVAVWEAVDGAWAFVEGMLAPLCGEARLYLMDWQEDEEGVSVYFGYLLDGAMVQVGGGGYGAKVVIQGGQVDSFEFNLRCYGATEETTLVLQEARAVAAMEALDAWGDELLLCYMDRGGETVRAGWIAQ